MACTSVRLAAPIFLSAPSARRATKACDKLVYVVVISIHALREEGDLANIGEQAILNKISIHALREEGDDKAVFVFLLALISIHALREEGDLSSCSLSRTTEISIHALREEGDTSEHHPEAQVAGNSYPRPP